MHFLTQCRKEAENESTTDNLLQVVRQLFQLIDFSSYHQVYF